MAIHLGRSSPNASRDRPERRREDPPGTGLTPCLPLLLGLAPGGVFPAAAIAGGAVRSYRTISPLPPMRSQAGPRGLGGVFSVALSLGSPPPAVNRHRAFRGARTFLPSHCWKERPSDRLAGNGMGESHATVKIRPWSSSRIRSDLGYLRSGRSAVSVMPRDGPLSRPRWWEWSHGPCSAPLPGGPG